VGSRPDLPGRSPLQNAYIHELGNLASYKASAGTTYLLFGVKGAVDDDSGYALQACVFDEPVKMKPPTAGTGGGGGGSSISFGPGISSGPGWDEFDLLELFFESMPSAAPDMVITFGKKS
jgi:hypothetical protein